VADQDDGIAFDPDWWTSGWNAFLPRQALELHMVVATATVREIDGDFAALVDELGADKFELRTGGLAGPIWWSFPDEEEPDPEQIEIDVALQCEFEETMARASRPLPITVADLVELMAELGVFERTRVDGIERWRSPDTLPLATETLPVSAEFAKDQDEHRWGDLHELSAQKIIRYAMDTREATEQIDTTLVRLASDIGIEVADLRFGFGNLTDSGFSLVDTASGADVDAETVEEVRAVTLRIDWECFGENRFGISM
jgi:hypothetical protein